MTEIEKRISALESRASLRAAAARSPDMRSEVARILEGRPYDVDLSEYLRGIVDQADDPALVRLLIRINDSV